MTTWNNDKEAFTYDIADALYLMSQNPPCKLVRVEFNRTEPITPIRFRMIFAGDKAWEARGEYLTNRFGHIDFTKLPELAKAIGDYIEAQRKEGVSI